ncbi:MAG: hypothetical protein WED04_05815 [Promethearchaeati archaeon SRVP18_Atabeyarchaeia-1]
MGYCEAWLGSRKVLGEKGDSKTEYRVEFAAPPENSPPPSYTPMEEKQADGGKKIYYSPWLSSIEDAKNELAKATDYCRRQSVKIIVYFEIR